MAQGTRGRWVRAAVFGLGVVASTGLVGCMSDDKPKDTKATTPPPKAGLPGTPTLPPGGAAGANTNAKAQWQPGGGTAFNGPGGNLQNGGFATTTGAPRTGTNNLNTTAAAPNFNNFAPGTPGVIGSPALPGVTPGGVQPIGGIGGPVGANTVTPSGGAITNYPPPDLLSIQPPAPQAGGPEFAQGVQPPTAAPSGLGPVAPSPLPPVSPPKGF